MQSAQPNDITYQLKRTQYDPIAEASLVKQEIKQTYLFDKLCFKPLLSTGDMFKKNDLVMSLNEGRDNLRTLWNAENDFEDYLQKALDYNLNWFEISKCSSLILSARKNLGLERLPFRSTPEQIKKQKAILRVCQYTDVLEEAKELLALPDSWILRASGK